MDRNQLSAWVLIILIVVGFVYYESTQELPVQEAVENVEKEVKDDLAIGSEVTNQNTGGEGIDTVENLSQLDSLKKALIEENLKKQFGIFSNSVNGEQEEILIENQKLKLFINTKGGFISKAIVKNYQTYDEYVGENKNEELVLFSGDSSFYQLNFEHQNRKLNTRDFYFETSEKSVVVTGEDESKTVKLVLKANTGGYIEFVYTIKSNDYMIDFDVNIVNLDRDISGVGKGLEFAWEQVAPDQEKSVELQRQNATVFYYSEESGRDYLTERSTYDSEQPEEALKWISFKQQYFSTVLVADKERITGAKLEVKYDEEDTTYVKHFASTFPIELSSNTSSRFKLFLGPNDYDLLKSYEVDLEDQLNLGWGIFRWVNQYFIYPVFQLLLSTGVGIGIAIILLTFAIKLVLFPVTYKNFLSSAKMRVIKPHLEKINTENKDADPMKKQQAVMALYKKTGVNPLAGCIPALLQMPILIALYRLFPTAIELRHKPFLWAEDLSSYDSIYDFPEGFSIPIYGSHVSLFTILMAISMFFYMRYNQQMTPSPSASGGGDMQEAIQKNMKMMMNFMPVMMLFMFNEFASGLSFYYLLANVITIAQTLIIKKYIIDEDKLLVKINEHMTKPMTKSKWQKKLEEIQKKQATR